jgi:hypothetical protein
MESFYALYNKSSQIEACTAFWSWVSVCETSLALSFHLPRSFRRIWWRVDLLIIRVSANMRTVTVWSSCTKSLMRTTLSLFRELEGRPDLVSSSTYTNRLCHSSTCVRDKASSPQVSRRSCSVSVAVLSSFTQKLMFTRCSNWMFILLTAQIRNWQLTWVFQPRSAT